jgi:hypothetical protein
MGGLTAVLPYEGLPNHFPQSIAHQRSGPRGRPRTPMLASTASSAARKVREKHMSSRSFAALPPPALDDMSGPRALSWVCGSGAGWPVQAVRPASPNAARRFLTFGTEPRGVRIFPETCPTRSVGPRAIRSTAGSHFGPGRPARVYWFGCTSRRDGPR